jgi:hypothetical protein
MKKALGDDATLILHCIPYTGEYGHKYAHISNALKVIKFVGRLNNKTKRMTIRFINDANIHTTDNVDRLFKDVANLQNVYEIKSMVDRKIRDWSTYLEIIQNAAEDSRVEISYDNYKISKDFDECIFECQLFTRKDIDRLRRFRDEVVCLRDYVYGEDNEEQIDSRKVDRIGILESIDYKRNTIKVDLDEECKDLAERGELPFPDTAILSISRLGDFYQAKRLKFGLNLLRNGQAKNSQLENYLFGDYIRESDKGSNIKIDKWLLDGEGKTPNQRQKDAVEGVLSAKNFFLIQGPPGTGKTTVIAEICYQNAICGGKTLIASQSNLAVDNALDKLVHNRAIIALRAGDISRIEQIGERYAPKNVVDTWFAESTGLCKKDFADVEKEYRILDLFSKRIDHITTDYKIVAENLLTLEDAKTASKIIKGEIAVLAQFTEAVCNELDKKIDDMIECMTTIPHEASDEKILAEVKRIFDNISANYKGNRERASEKRAFFTEIGRIKYLCNSLKTSSPSIDLTGSFINKSFDDSVAETAAFLERHAKIQHTRDTMVRHKNIIQKIEKFIIVFVKIY